MRGMRENQIIVMIKEPGKEPVIEPLFDNKLEAFQEAVGGPIEVCTLFSDIAIVCNEEGKLRGLPYNTTICGMEFVGTILSVGIRGEEFASLKAAHIPTVRKIMEGVQTR